MVTAVKIINIYELALVALLLQTTPECSNKKSKASLIVLPDYFVFHHKER